MHFSQEEERRDTFWSKMNAASDDLSVWFSLRLHWFRLVWPSVFVGRFGGCCGRFRCWRRCIDCCFHGCELSVLFVRSVLCVQFVLSVLRVPVMSCLLGLSCLSCILLGCPYSSASFCQTGERRRQVPRGSGRPTHVEIRGVSAWSFYSLSVSHFSVVDGASCGVTVWHLFSVILWHRALERNRLPSKLPFDHHCRFHSTLVAEQR